MPAASTITPLTFPLDLPRIVAQSMRDAFEGATLAGATPKIDVLLAGQEHDLSGLPSA